MKLKEAGGHAQAAGGACEAGQRRRRNGTNESRSKFGRQAPVVKPPQPLHLSLRTPCDGRDHDPV
jgi:hypothetical protein